jgi:hypothetical protein
MSLRRNWDSTNPSLDSECALPPGTGGGGGAHSGLAKYSKYSITVLAYNAVGPGPNSLPEVLVTTLEDGKQNETCLRFPPLLNVDCSRSVWGLVTSCVSF